MKSKNLYAITNGDSERRERERKKNGNWHSCAQPVNECNTQCLHINRENTTAIDAIQIFAARACTRLHSSKIRVNKNAICIWLYWIYKTELVYVRLIAIIFDSAILGARALMLLRRSLQIQTICLQWLCFTFETKKTPKWNSFTSKCTDVVILLMSMRQWKYR